MRLKPKSTTLNKRAILYKRFTTIQQSLNTRTIYQTVVDSPVKNWMFDYNTLTFIETDIQLGEKTQFVSVNQQILQFETHYFQYQNQNGVYQWQELDTLPDNPLLMLAKSNNIGKYQLNKYYFYGTFDYTISGSESSTTTQFIKGNIMPLTTFEIKHYNDIISLQPDDLVVIGSHLYSVENPEKTYKRMPYPFAIYTATLNSIL